MRSARSETPSWSAQAAAVARSAIHCTISAPLAGSPSRSSSATRAEASVSWKWRSRLVVRCASSRAPGALGSTRKAPTCPSAPRAGTSTRCARCAAGTHCLTPSSRKPPLTARKAVVGRAGSWLPASSRPALRITSPLTTPGSQRCCCAWLPKRAIGSAAITSVASAGTGATVRPISSSSRQVVKKPRALPPKASGRPTPSRFERASSRQRSRSMPSALASAFSRRSLRAAILEDLAREVAHLLLLFREREIHRVPRDLSSCSAAGRAPSWR